MYDDWMHVDIELPEQNGHYLVIQKSEERGTRAYRWVRFFRQGEWIEPHIEKYGPIVYWIALPPMPRDL